jgi:glycosyltransferase involved in cell wall biosynthesis
MRCAIMPKRNTLRAMAAAPSEPPTVSVVAATHNRSDRLRRLLESLRAQTFRDFEVVICDDASSDDTQAVLAAADGLDLRSLRNATSGGPSKARNAAWRVARGRLIAFTDDDCEVSPGWLEAGVRAWGGDPDRFVQGPVGPIAAERDRLGAFSYTIVIEGPTRNYETANIFYPRDLLERVGGFDEAFPRVGEDTDLGWRARAAGGVPVFEPAAKVEHAVVEIGARGYLRRLWAWSDSIHAYKRHPGLRKHLHEGIFWNPSHYLLVRAIVGLLLLRKRWAWPLALWLGKWFLSWELAESRKHAGTPWLAPWWVVRDVVETAACARGSLRYRVLVL